MYDHDYDYKADDDDDVFDASFKLNNKKWWRENGNKNITGINDCLFVVCYILNGNFG